MAGKSKLLQKNKHKQFFQHGLVKSEIKKAKSKANNHYKNETLAQIVNSQPKFNIVLKAA